MGKASGLLLVFVGLGLAAYAVLPIQNPPAGGSDDFDFGLNRHAVSKSEAANPGANPPASSITRGRAQTRGSEGAQATASAPSVVTLAPHSPRLAVNSAPKVGALATDRTHLARELQKELRRVGCYDGEINGGWTTSTKRAMKTFMERVNASLPVEEPDLVLLSLVQGQADKTCGRPCPPGEAAIDGGRCVPAAMASSPRKAAHSPGTSRDAPQPAIGLSTAAPTPSGPPLEGRMGLAGPNEEAPTTALGAPQAAAPVRPSVAGAVGQAAPGADGRTGPAADRNPSRRFDAQSFFRRMDKHSAF
jgi:hypothetical protein